VLLQLDTNGSGYYTNGKISLQGEISSPVILQNSTNSANAFLVQDSAGSNIFGVDTTDTNLVNNPGLEVSTAGWTYSGAQSAIVGIFRDTSNSYLGVGSLKFIMSATATDQARFTFNPSTLLVSGTTYTLSFYARDSATSYSTLTYGHREGAADTNCTAVGAISTIWQRYSCSFTWTTITSPYIFISAGTASKTISIDAASLEPGGTVTPYGAGSIYFNGVITSPVNFQNKTDSTTAFQIQNASSSTMLAVDTADNFIKIGDSTGTDTATTLLVLDSSTADPTTLTNRNGGL
jgi:hypothetical protein